MKKYLPLFFAIIMVFSTNLLISQNLTFEPANPVPGEKIQITYNSIGTDLQRVEKIEAICYEFSEDGPIATEIYLQIKNNAYSSTIQTSKDAKVVFISLSADDKKDDNNGDGYAAVIYQKDRKTPQPGAFASLASIYGNYYRTVGLERNNEKALVYLQKEYSQFPEAKIEGKYLQNYSFYAAKAKDEQVLNECKELIKTLRMNPLDEDDLLTISSIYSNIGDDEASKAIDTKIVEEYPEGELAQRNLVNSFYNTKILEEKLEIYSNIQLKFGDKETSPPPMDRINRNVALEYGKMEDWAKFNTFFKLIKDPTVKASILNNIAWPLSGESIYATPKNAAKGRELSKQSLDLIESEMESGVSKPASMTKNQWKKQLKYSYGMYADTYALCAYHEGDYNEALKYQKIACEASDFKNGGITELYFIYLEKLNGSKAVESELQTLIARGVATDKMKEQYQRAYIENNTLETALEKNMAFLQSMADEKKMEDLKGKMIEEKSPDFALVNLNGEKVALSDLKGKVVVLDFWATWCGPCKASFPGMQNAVDKYKNSDDVVFLFIDTWEKEENKEENAQNFMTEKGYNFNVLMDNENEIVAKFKVSGIPTKFVVDKNGNIRFKSVGFSGNNANLLSELSMMIDMAKEAGSNEKTMP